MPVTKSVKGALTTYTSGAQTTVYDSDKKVIYNTTPSSPTNKIAILKEFIKGNPKIKVAMYAGGHGTSINEECSFIWVRTKEDDEKGAMLKRNMEAVRAEYAKDPDLKGHIDVRFYATRIVGWKGEWTCHLIHRTMIGELNGVLKETQTFKKGQDFEGMVVYISQCNTDTWMKTLWDGTKNQFKLPDEDALIKAAGLTKTA